MCHSKLCVGPHAAHNYIHEHTRVDVAILALRTFRFLFDSVCVCVCVCVCIGGGGCSDNLACPAGFCHNMLDTTGILHLKGVGKIVKF